MPETMPIEQWRTGYVLIEGDRRSVLKVRYGVSEGLAIWQGDIVLGTAAELARSTARQPHGYTIPPEAGHLVIEADIRVGAGFKWPNNTMFYAIDPALPVQDRVTDAIAHWRTNTPVQFVQRTGESNYIFFTPGSGCSSPVGMIGGKQNITLEAGCLKGQVIHEIAHSFGLWHEQSRPDRDNYVTIQIGNLDKPAMAPNFDKLAATIGMPDGGYDYGSIMHYEADAFAKPNTDTIVTKPPGIPIGQRNGLSGGDIMAISERCKVPIVLGNAFDQTVMQLGDADSRSTVVQWSYQSGNTSQQWLLRLSGQGSFLLVNQSNNRALVYVPSTGQLVTAVPDITQGDQRWQMESRPGGRMRIINPGTRNYLAITGNWGNPDGRPIRVQALPSGNLSLEYEWFRRA